MPNADDSKKYRQLNTRVVRAYLKANPCEICGETDLDVLEFDHVRGKKHRSISRMTHTSYSLETIFLEIAKCRVLCANCHARATAERRRANQKDAQ